MKRLLIGVVLVFCTASVALADGFVFTAIPDEDESRLRSRFDKVAVYLSKELGVPVKYVPVKSYAAAVTAFKNDQVQLAWFGGLSGVRARRSVPNSTAIAQGYEDQFFVTYFIAHKSAGCRRKQEFSEEYQREDLYLWVERVDIGALDAGIPHPDAVQATAGQGLRSCRIQRRPFPHHRAGPVRRLSGWRGELQGLGKRTQSRQDRSQESSDRLENADLSRLSMVGARRRGQEIRSGFTGKIRKALLALNDPDLLKSFPRSKFVPASNADYKPIVDVGKEIGLLD